MKRSLIVCLLVSMSVACGTADGKGPATNSGTPTGETDASSSNADSSTPTSDAGSVAEPETSYDIVVEEVNFGDEVEEFSDDVATADEDYGATVADGRLSVEVDQGDLRLVVGIDTTASNTLPGEKATDSSFSDGTFVSLDIGNSFWDLQGGGAVTFRDCPDGVGSTVTVELESVRLASSISNSIKEVSGVVTVEVFDSDGSVECSQ